MAAVEVALAVAVRVLRLHAPGVVVQVLGGVPPLWADIHAAAEGEGVVDDDGLLVMAGPHRQLAVEHQLDARAGEELAVLQGEPVLGGGDRQRRLPAEEAHIHVGLFLGQRLQEHPDAVAVRSAAAFLRMEQGLGLEGPVQQVDGVARALHCALGGGEVVGGVDDQRGLVGDLAPPASGPDLELHLRLP